MGVLNANPCANFNVKLGLVIKVVPFCSEVPYFFGYKMEVFSFQNNPKDLDPSCKMDLDLWDCLERVKLVL